MYLPERDRKKAYFPIVEWSHCNPSPFLYPVGIGGTYAHLTSLFSKPLGPGFELYGQLGSGSLNYLAKEPASF